MFESALTNALLATILASLAFLATRRLRRPAIAHALWLIVLLKLVTPPVAKLEVPSIPVATRPSKVVPNETLPGVVAATATGESVLQRDALRPVDVFDRLNEPSLGTTFQPLAISSFRWRETLIVIWIGGIITIAVCAIARMAAFHAQLHKVGRLADKVDAIAKNLSPKFNLRKTPSVQVVASRVSPMVWTLGWRTSVLIPQELLMNLDHKQTETLIAHEFAHIQRRDHWVRWLELVCVALYWWLPVVWWARRNLRQAEEECCDGIVLRVLPDRARDYVSTLLQTVEFLLNARQPLPITGSGMGSAQVLQRRCEMILRQPAPREFSRLVGLVLVLIAASVLPWGIQSQASADNSRNLSGEDVGASDLATVGSDTGADLNYSDLLEDGGQFSSTSDKPVNKRRAKIESIPSHQRITIGDLEFEMRELLSLESFVPSRRSGPFVAANLDNMADDAPNHAILKYNKTSRVFASVTYSKLETHPDYFKFVVTGKYDPASARERLLDQLWDALGKPNGGAANRWYRTMKVDDRDAILEFRVDDSRREAPSVHIVVRYRADWGTAPRRGGANQIGHEK